MKSRRNFLKKGIAITVAATALPALRNKLWAASPLGGTSLFILPPLPYGFDALEPYIDAATMEIHHDKHHAGYVKKLNKAIGELDNKGMDLSTLEKIFENISGLPDGVSNNAGGHWNHSLFWSVMKPKGGGPPTGEIARAIDASFGSFENLQNAFNDAAMKRFGSGWAWLAAHKGTLKVSSTPNQDNPLMASGTIKGKPILGLDVWEHAYYLKYQNKRAEYVNAWWNVVNWDEVNRRLVGE